MAEITINGMSKDAWLKEKVSTDDNKEGQVAQKVKEVESANIEDYIDTERLNNNYRVEYKRKERGNSLLMLVNDNYMRDYQVVYFVKKKDISVYNLKKHTYEGYKIDKGKEMKKYVIGGKTKTDSQIIAEAFLKKGTKEARVRLIDEDTLSERRNIDNIEWYEADILTMKDSVNLDLELEELSRKGVKFIQVDKYIFIGNGEVLSTYQNNYLTISSTRRNYGIKYKGTNILIIPEAVVHIATEYTREEWNELSDNEKITIMRRRDFRGEEKYVSRFSQGVKDELVREATSRRIMRENKEKAKSKSKSKGMSTADKVNAILDGLGRNRGVVTESKKYILVDNGAIISVRTGKELSRIGKEGDLGYMVYIGKQQKVIMQRSVYNFLKVYDKNSIEDKSLHRIAGKKNKFYIGNL